MSLYLDLLPPPQFDRSLVAYTVGNFQRVKDVLVRASGRVYVTSVYANGPYPISWTIATPFRADVLVNIVAAGYAAGIGQTGLNTYVDGAAFGPGTLFYYFNIASTHMTWTGNFVIRSQAAGNHVWNLQAGGGLLSDGGDHPSLSFVFVEV